MPNHDDISLDRRTIVRILAATSCFLLFASMTGQVSKYGLGHDSAYGLIRLFDVDMEGNIPTFFSAAILLLASLLLALITTLKWTSPNAYSRHWAILSMILLYMAVDEFSGIHETFIKPTQWLLGQQRPSGLFHYRWTISGIAIVGVVVLTYLKFFLHLPRQTQWHFFTATAMFLSGALGMEMVESYYTGLHAMGHFQLSMLATVEEGLEMAGVIVFINALLTYVNNYYRDVSLMFGESKKDPCTGGASEFTSYSIPNIRYQHIVSLNRRPIVRILAATSCFLIFASMAGQVSKYGLGHDSAYGLVRLFYVDTEGNIPTIFSAVILLLAALLVAFITILKRLSRDPYRQHWGIISFILLFMAVDEAVGLHEMLNRVGWWVTGQRKGGMFHYGWVMFGMAMIMAVALSYLKFFFSLPKHTRLQFFTAAAVFVSGAIGVEVLEGYYSASHGGESSFEFSLFVTIEEGLEMAGVIVFIRALLIYIMEHYKDARLRFDEPTDNLVVPMQRHAA